MAKGFAGGVTRWLGASALAHAALCAGVIALAWRAGNGREAVLKVTLITVAAPAASPLPPPVPPAPEPRASNRPGSSPSARSAARIPAPPSREGAGRPGGAGPKAATPGIEMLPGATGTPVAIAPPEAAPVGAAPQGGRSERETATGPILKDAGAAHLAQAQFQAGASTGWGPSSGVGRGSAPGARHGVAGTGPGGGGGVGASGGGAPSRPPSLADLVAQIHRRIEGAKHYPEDARRQGIEGTVSVRFRVRGDGHVEAAEVVASSGSRLLDEGSLDTVRRAAPFPSVRG